MCRSMASRTSARTSCSFINPRSSSSQINCVDEADDRCVNRCGLPVNGITGRSPFEDDQNLLMYSGADPIDGEQLRTGGVHQDGAQAPDF